MVLAARQHMKDEKQARDLVPDLSESLTLGKVNDLFITENPCIDVPLFKTHTPKMPTQPTKSSQAKAITRRPSKKKITMANNWDVNAAQKSVPRSKVVVNFALKKNELISNQIISNIRSILRNIENRNDKGLSQTYNSGLLQERRPLDMIPFEQNKLSGSRQADPKKNLANFTNAQLSSFSAYEKSDTNLLRPKNSNFNDVLMEKDIFLTKGRSTERTRPLRAASKSEDREQPTGILKRKRSILKSNKENQGPTSVIGSIARLQSVKQLGGSLIDNSFSNQMQDKSSMVVQTRRQKAALTEMMVSNALVKASQSVSRRQKFLIRSNTNHPVDRKLIRQVSGGSLIEANAH